MRAIRRFTVRPVLPDALAALGTLAVNLRWSWHPATQDVFRSIDPDLWDSTGNDPVRLLGAVSSARLGELAVDPDFLGRLDVVARDLDAYLNGERWFQRLPAEERPAAIGYFSPEFGITSVLPQYSGGLGILAGDHLKSASDLGAPIVGVGLLYRYGYFRQSLSRVGWQEETYPVLDPDGLPISLLREEDGTAARVAIGVPGGGDLVARIWVAQVGRVPLLLLDSDMEGNDGIAPRRHRPAVRRDLGTPSAPGAAARHRWRACPAGLLAAHRCRGAGGVPHQRGPRRLPGSGADPGADRRSDGPRLDFDTALEVSRAGTVFTTHTPVPAGIDRFPRDLISQYFGGNSPAAGVPLDRILALGAEDYDGGDPGVFNMAVMGFRLAQRANGVSLLHGEVSRGMFNGLWSAFDEAEVPIGSITNGVHAPTWVAREVFELAAAAGANTDSGDSSVFDSVDQVPGTDLWSTKRGAASTTGRRCPQPPARLLHRAWLRCRRAGLDRLRLQCRRADHRVRAPGAVVQATHADAA